MSEFLRLIVCLLAVNVSICFAEDSKPMSKQEVLDLLPRGIDMDPNDEKDFERLILQGSATYEVLGEELLRVDDWTTANRIITIFIKSRGDKTLPVKYMKRFLEIPKVDPWWATARSEAADAIREFETSLPEQTPAREEDATSNASPQHPDVKNADTTSTTTGGNSTLVTPWRIIVMLIAVGCGLPWLLLKWRKP